MLTDFMSHLCSKFTYTWSTGLTDHLATCVPSKEYIGGLGMLPFQDLATWVCLTGPFLDHTLGQQEVLAKEAKKAPISGPICLFRIYSPSYALEYDRLYFNIITI